jgi:hypothetical protein
MSRSHHSTTGPEIVLVAAIESNAVHALLLAIQAAYFLNQSSAI